MAKQTPTDCEAGSGLYNLHCRDRFDRIDSGIKDLNEGLIHIRKAMLGDLVDKIEGVVPMLTRHNEYILEHKKQIEERRKAIRNDRRLLVGSVFSALAAVAAAIMTAIFSG